MGSFSIFHIVIISLGVALLIIAALWRGRPPTRTIKARNISASTVVNGDNSGPINHRPAPGNPTKSPPDRIAWGIGLIGVAVAVAQLVADLVKP